MVPSSHSHPPASSIFSSRLARNGSQKSHWRTQVCRGTLAVSVRLHWHQWGVPQTCLCWLKRSSPLPSDLQQRRGSVSAASHTSTRYQVLSGRCNEPVEHHQSLRPRTPVPPSLEGLPSIRALRRAPEPAGHSSCICPGSLDLFVLVLPGWLRGTWERSITLRGGLACFLKGPSLSSGSFSEVPTPNSEFRGSWSPDFSLTLEGVVGAMLSWSSLINPGGAMPSFGRPGWYFLSRVWTGWRGGTSFQEGRVPAWSRTMSSDLPLFGEWQCTLFLSGGRGVTLQRFERKGEVSFLARADDMYQLLSRSPCFQKGTDLHSRGPSSYRVNAAGLPQLYGFGVFRFRSAARPLTRSLVIIGFLRLVPSTAWEDSVWSLPRLRRSLPTMISMGRVPSSLPFGLDVSAWIPTPRSFCPVGPAHFSPPADETEEERGSSKGCEPKWPPAVVHFWTSTLVLKHNKCLTFLCLVCACAAGLWYMQTIQRRYRHQNWGHTSMRTFTVALFAVCSDIHLRPLDRNVLPALVFYSAVYHIVTCGPKNPRKTPIGGGHPKNLSIGSESFWPTLHW